MEMDTGRRNNKIQLERAFPSWNSELEKERIAREEKHSQSIGEFLDWLRQDGSRVHKSINEILGDYYGVDHNAIEQQRRMALRYAKWMNKNDK
jgi:hypothetical protein